MQTFCDLDYVKSTLDLLTKEALDYIPFTKEIISFQSKFQVFGNNQPKPINEKRNQYRVEEISKVLKETIEKKDFKSALKLSCISTHYLNVTAHLCEYFEQFELVPLTDGELLMKICIENSNINAFNQILIKFPTILEKVKHNKNIIKLYIENILRSSPSKYINDALKDREKKFFTALIKVGFPYLYTKLNEKYSETLNAMEAEICYVSDYNNQFNNLLRFHFPDYEASMTDSEGLALIKAEMQKKEFLINNFIDNFQGFNQDSNYGISVCEEILSIRRIEYAANEKIFNFLESIVPKDIDPTEREKHLKPQILNNILIEIEAFEGYLSSFYRVKEISTVIEHINSKKEHDLNSEEFVEEGEGTEVTFQDVAEYKLPRENLEHEKSNPYKEIISSVEIADEKYTNHQSKSAKLNKSISGFFTKEPLNMKGREGFKNKSDKVLSKEEKKEILHDSIKILEESKNGSFKNAQLVKLLNRLVKADVTSISMGKDKSKFSILTGGEGILPQTHRPHDGESDKQFLTNICTALREKLEKEFPQEEAQNNDKGLVKAVDKKNKHKNKNNKGFNFSTVTEGEQGVTFEDQINLFDSNFTFFESLSLDVQGNSKESNCIKEENKNVDRPNSKLAP